MKGMHIRFRWIRDMNMKAVHAGQWRRYPTLPCLSRSPPQPRPLFLDAQLWSNLLPYGLPINTLRRHFLSHVPPPQHTGIHDLGHCVVGLVGSALDQPSSIHLLHPASHNAQPWVTLGFFRRLRGTTPRRVSKVARCATHGTFQRPRLCAGWTLLLSEAPLARGPLGAARGKSKRGVKH